MKFENELVEHVKEFRLREKGLKTLKKLLAELAQTEKEIDGYIIENLRFKYIRHEVRILDETQANTILARFDIITNDQESIIPIGYYDLVTNFKGEVIDDFLVFERGKEE